MPTLFEWPSKITTGSVRERVSPFSGICHTCWKRKTEMTTFHYHIHGDDQFGDLFCMNGTYNNGL